MQTADVFKIAEHITTPLMLAALVVLVIFASLRTKISEPRARQLFILALVAIVLGIAADMTGKVLRPPFLHGRVYSPPNDITQGIGHADVILRYNSGGEDAVCSDPKGEFQFAIPPGELGRGATVWAAADKYPHSEPKPIKLVADADVLISLQLQGGPPSTQPPDSIPPAATSGSMPPSVQPAPPPVAMAPASKETTCLNGTWKEYLTGRNEEPPDAHEWTAAAGSDSLNLVRQDNLVSGEFVKAGSAWVGKLRWRSGGTWSNVILSPASDCSEIRTNQFWSFKRP